MGAARAKSSGHHALREAGSAREQLPRPFKWGDSGVAELGADTSLASAARAASRTRATCRVRRREPGATGGRVAMVERGIPIVRELERQIRRDGGRATGTVAARATALRLARQSGDPVRLRRALPDLAASCLSDPEALLPRNPVRGAHARLFGPPSGRGRSGPRATEVMRRVLACSRSRVSVSRRARL